MVTVAVVVEPHLMEPLAPVAAAVLRAVTAVEQEARREQAVGPNAVVRGAASSSAMWCPFLEAAHSFEAFHFRRLRPRTAVQSQPCSQKDQRTLNREQKS